MVELSIQHELRHDDNIINKSWLMEPVLSAHHWLGTLRR